ncbi:serine hydrolase [Streptomyces boncukensis]|uniref:serine hydrolase n=1 Tax=Streptomyces boncukensis TaxID=2711219 RepID=UPI0030B9D6EA
MRVSIAARDVGTGRTVYAGGALYVSASVVKLEILAALLLQRPAPEARERELAAAMVERSDNEAAGALWRSIGGSAGLDAASRRFGLTRTVGGDGGWWGLTRTTAADQLALLRGVYGDAPSPLTPAARAYVQERMARVVGTQRWGVSAAGESTAGLKNGWMPRAATGLWVVHSAGRVTARGRPYLLAVLSDGHPGRDEGIAAVERAARAAVSALRARSRSGGREAGSGGREAAGISP